MVAQAASPGLTGTDAATAFRKRIVRTLRFLLLLSIVAAAWPAARAGGVSWRFWLAGALFFLSNLAFHFERTEVFSRFRLSAVLFLFDTAVLAFMLFESGERSIAFFVIFGVTLLMAAMAKNEWGALAGSVAACALYGLLTRWGRTGVELLSVAFATHAALLAVFALFVARLAREADLARGETRETPRRLHANEDILQAVVDGAPDAIISADAAGRITFWNRSAETLFGWPAAEAVGRPLTIIIPERLRAAHDAGLRRFGETGVPRLAGRTVELEALRRDGSEFPVELTLSPRRAGGPAAFTAIVRDATERLRHQSALRQSEERFHQMAESIREVFWMTDPARTRTLYVSPAYESIWGRPCAGLYASPGDWLDAIHPDDRDRVRQAALAKQAAGQYDEEYRIVRPDGSVRWIRERAYAVRDARGAVCRLTGVAEDITDHKTIETQLRQAQKIEAIGRLAGGVAHDFNNLLTIIKGYSQMLLQQAGPQDPSRPGLEEIQRAGDRGADLTRQLLAFSRKQMLEPRLLDLNRLVADMDNLLRRLLGEQIRIEKRLAPGLGCVRADPGQIEQVLMNLAVNARDAMSARGTLTIGTGHLELGEDFVRANPGARPGPSVFLEVSDTGAGMDDATLARLFEPFFTTKEKGRGTGLGLSTVYGIVKQSGGYIQVQSAPGRGATFRVFLPRVSGPADAAAEATARRAAAGSETILLVEDDATVRRLARSILVAQRYEVIEAGDGREAVDAVARHHGPLHLLLTDAVMPNMGGIELARRLVAARPGLRVLLMSGYTDTFAFENGEVPEGLAFLHKPFSPDHLVNRVREVLDGQIVVSGKLPAARRPGAPAAP